MGMAAAVAGTHPLASWEDTEVSPGARYQFLYASMRELARREPTFALHVHVAVPDERAAVRALNGVREELPLLLALSANSPFWQGRDSGLASARIPVFQAFPRTGTPRAFGTYEAYVEAVDVLIRCDAIPEPTFLWWDARLQPRLGTIEVRIMDAQTRVRDTAALAALVQCLVRREALERADDREPLAPEVLEENRFLAARDGMDAKFVDPAAGRCVPVAGQARGDAALVRAARRVAALRGASSRRSARSPSARARCASARSAARAEGLRGVLRAMHGDFVSRAAEPAVPRLDSVARGAEPLLSAALAGVSVSQPAAWPSPALLSTFRLSSAHFMRVAEMSIPSRSSTNSRSSSSSSPTGIPITSSEAIEADACEIAQPWPEKRTSATLSSTTRSWTFSSSPQSGLKSSNSRSGVLQLAPVMGLLVVLEDLLAVEVVHG